MKCAPPFSNPFCGIITHILSAVSIIILTQFVKKRPSTPWFVFKVFTFDHLFGYRSDFFNNLAILKHKNRCLSSSTNSVDLHFHEGVEKIKENVKNTKIENLKNGQEKYGGKIIKKKYGGKINQIVVQLGQNLKNIY